MTSKPDLVERFFQLLVQRVRDPSVRAADNHLDPRFENSVAREWRKLAAGSDAEAAIRFAVPDVVDRTLFHLLDAVDNGVVEIVVRDEDGVAHSLEDIGRAELAGSWAAAGPQQAYAKARINVRDTMQELRDLANSPYEEPSSDSDR